MKSNLHGMTVSELPTCHYTLLCALTEQLAGDHACSPIESQNIISKCILIYCTQASSTR